MIRASRSRNTRSAPNRGHMIKHVFEENHPYIPPVSAFGEGSWAGHAYDAAGFQFAVEHQ